MEMGLWFRPQWNSEVCPVSATRSMWVSCSCSSCPELFSHVCFRFTHRCSSCSAALGFPGCPSLGTHCIKRGSLCSNFRCHLEVILHRKFLFTGLLPAIWSLLVPSMLRLPLLFPLIIWTIPRARSYQVLCVFVLRWVERSPTLFVFLMGFMTRACERSSTCIRLVARSSP